MNALSKSHLFDLMRQTAEVVDAHIKEELSRMSLGDASLCEAVMHLPAIRAQPNARGARPKLRATFVRLVFEMLSEDDWQKAVPVAAAAELLAISSYVIDDLLDHQQMRDGEGATWITHGAAEAVMAAQLQREVAERILLRLALPEQRVLRLAQLLNEIFYEGYLGQWMNSRMTEPCSMEDYLKRCEKIAGRFHSGLAKMAAVLADTPDEIGKTVSHFAFSHGMALQIRNDLVDYIPSSITEEAGAQALHRMHFEDFRNRRWTMPLLHAYKHASASDREQLESLMRATPFSEETAAWLTKLLVSTGAYEASLRLISDYKEAARTGVLAFPQSPAREALVMLFDCVENSRRYVQRLTSRLS